MRQHLFHQFKKVDHLAEAMDHLVEGMDHLAEGMDHLAEGMGLLEEEEVTSNILDLHRATLSIRGRHQIIPGLLPGIHTTLGRQLGILPTILDLLPVSNGPTHPLVQQEEHTHQRDTMAPQVATIHLQ